MASAYHMFAWVQEIVLRTYVAHFCAATGTSASASSLDYSYCKRGLRSADIFGVRSYTSTVGL